MDQIYSKMVFPLENGESEHHHWTLHIRVSLGTKLWLKDTLKASDNFRNKQQKCIKCMNNFLYAKVYISWKLVQYTIHWDKTRMWRKFSLDKINVTKMHCFPSRDPTFYSFTFNSRFLYELEHKFVSLKACVGFSIFDSVSLLLKFTFFYSTKGRVFLTLKRRNCFQN